MSRFVHKSHNVGVLLYHLVCPAKYRRLVFDAPVEAVLKQVCLEIALRYEIHFLEIGADFDHVHFLIQSVPTYSPTKIARPVKSITGREIFVRCPAGQKQLWGGQFWSDGFFISTVGVHGSEETIGNYVKGQGQGHAKHYQQLHTQPVQPTLFDDNP